MYDIESEYENLREDGEESNSSAPPPPMQEVQVIVLFDGALVGPEEQHHCALSCADDYSRNVGRRDDDGDKSLPLVGKRCRTIGKMRITSHHVPEAQFGVLY